MKFLFDLGGVFFDWDPKYFYKEIFDDPKDLIFFLSNVCNESWNKKQDCGRSIEEAENELIPLFPNYEEQIKMYYPNHRKMIKGTFDLSIKVLENLKSLNYECYVLSNWSSETFYGPQHSMVEDYSFLKKFDGLLISGEDKLIKPDSKIYHLAINRFNLEPINTVFIDDRLENIQEAKKIGFNVIHLQDTQTIQTEIEKFLI